MFGYLTACAQALGEEQAKRYKSFYCGVCMSLKRRHGQLSRLTLNYDLSFLVLLLGSLYEPEEEREESCCIVHPFKKQEKISTEISAYAADMNLMLAYLKCLDNWQDEGSILSAAEAAALKPSYRKLAELYPRQHNAMCIALDELHKLEKEGIEDADAASGCFGRLMAEVLVYREDRWSDALRCMGMALGKFIYIMDAVMDLNSDTVHNSYNPFRRYYGLDNQQRFRDILKMLLAECVYYFDKLPLVQDVDILKNILCVGLWQQFDAKFAPQKGKEDVSGPL